MEIKEFSRLVPIQESTFYIEGRTHCAAPIIEVAQAVYMIEGNVNMAPVAGAQYVVKGEFGESHSAVWLEDMSTGKQQGNKLFIEKSTAVNRGTLLFSGPEAAKHSKQHAEEIAPP